VTYVPPTQPSIRVVKSFPRKGGTVQWSNRYFFTGANLTSGQFTALCALLQAEEVLLFAPNCSIVEFIQYDAGSDVPVRTATASAPGTLSMTGKEHTPSDCAAVVRFSTDQRTVKNHPIYLFKYMHGVTITAGDPGDDINSTQKTRYDSYGADVVAGFNDGTTLRHVCGPFGAVALGAFVHPYITHRDFPT
jgi:hypothetical protein